MDFDLIAFLEPKRFDHGGGKADREAVSPFGDLHADLLVGYTHHKMYIQWKDRSSRFGYRHRSCIRY
jgi:hypothetical protein